MFLSASYVAIVFGSTFLPLHFTLNFRHIWHSLGNTPADSGIVEVNANDGKRILDDGERKLDSERGSIDEEAHHSDLIFLLEVGVPSTSDLCFLFLMIEVNQKENRNLKSDIIYLVKL